MITVKLTDAEAAFLTMCRMAGFITEPMEHLKDRPMLKAVRSSLYGSQFPIIASTFAKLCLERPELQECYDKAKEAWRKYS